MGSVLIESRLVGKLIGPRGATIQQLQSEYNVHISISKEDDAVSFSLKSQTRFFNNGGTFSLRINRMVTELLKSVVLMKMFKAQLLLSRRDSARAQVAAAVDIEETAIVDKVK